MIDLSAGLAGVGARPLRIVLPGGSGQVGHALARHFQAQKARGRRRSKAWMSASTWPDAA